VRYDYNRTIEHPYTSTYNASPRVLSNAGLYQRRLERITRITKQLEIGFRINVETKMVRNSGYSTKPIITTSFLRLKCWEINQDTESCN